MAGERRPHPTRTGRPASRAVRPAGASVRRSTSAGSGRPSRTLRPGTARPPAAPRGRPSRRRAPGPVRIPLAHGPRRLRVVLLAMAIALSLCAGRLLQLQGFDSAAFALDSTEQLTRTLPLLPSRGDITDRNGLVMASTEAAVAVTADPTLTGPDAPAIAAVLSPYLHIAQPQLVTLLTKPGTRFVYLAKRVPALTYAALADALTRKKLTGVFRESDPVRTYPGGSVAAPVVGYLGADGQGRGGLEWSMNSELAGVEGKEVYESAPNGSKIPLGTSSTTPAVNGINYQLTIDSELQWMAEQRVAQAVAKTKALSGFAITMNVKTGEILAMANAPGYSQANLREAGKKHLLLNRAVSNPYEPGSVEKVLTSAALIDSGTATPETRVEIPARLASGGGSIKDAFVHKKLYYLMRGVVSRSSNIGTILLTRQMRTKTLHDYLLSFGLGSKTGVELPGEASGTVPAATMPGYTRDQVAFGQALTVTGVQQAAAIAGVINGGVYNPPTVIKSATDSSGHPVPIERRTARQVVKPATSAAVRDLMRAVVDSPNGVSHLAVPGYHTGGKTGTAQRPDVQCRCYKGYVTSYIGFAPLNDPKILTYVVLDDPKTGDTGTSTAAPVFKDIMSFALPRYSVEPSTTKLVAEPYSYQP